MGPQHFGPVGRAGEGIGISLYEPYIAAKEPPPSPTNLQQRALTDLLLR